MCYCCCPSRKGIIIYMITINSIAFIYGIVAMSYFGSSTKVYKALRKKLDVIGTSSSSSSLSSNNIPYNTYYNYPYYYLRKLANNQNSYTYNKEVQEMVEEALDSISLNHIENLNSTGGHSVSVIKNLKSIENGIGVILFIYSLIFLAAEIVFLIFSFGNKEFTPLPETTFKVLNGIKIACLSFSITMIFLSILYGILLAVALIQYIDIVPYYDKCAVGIIVGMVYGYYYFWFYITLSSLFSKERAVFVLVQQIIQDLELNLMLVESQLLMPQ